MAAKVVDVKSENRGANFDESCVTRRYRWSAKVVDVKNGTAAQVSMGLARLNGVGGLRR